MGITRRELLRSGSAGAGLLCVPLWMPYARADQAAAPVIRYEVRSQKGKEMLQIYAQAVAKMMKLPASDPRSWTFQWYTHAVPTSTTKAETLQATFPTDSPARELADKMWSTCQAHFTGPEDQFLPWHRMYVMYFEEIIRNISGHPEFTLPYWDYVTPMSDGSESVLPEEFRKQGDPIWGSLYRGHRWAGTNGGRPVNQGPGGALNLDCMKFAAYSGSSGLCENLDNAPHGALHVDVGNEVGMAQVPWAADDPIFYLHHAFIDLIYASWIKAGGSTPTGDDFSNVSYTFADGKGNAVQGKTSEVLDTTKTVVPYVYDHYLARPAGSVPFGQSNLGTLLAETNAPATTEGKIHLGSAPSRVKMVSKKLVLPGTPAGQPNTFALMLHNVPAETPHYLILSDISASAEPSTGYDVYLDLPTNAKPTRDDPSFIGSVSFFGIGMKGMHPHGNKEFSFVVTDKVKALIDAGRLTSDPTVTLVPGKSPAKGSAPTIGKISLQTG
jgi:tyrosinase